MWAWDKLYTVQNSTVQTQTYGDTKNSDPKKVVQNIAQWLSNRTANPPPPGPSPEFIFVDYYVTPETIDLFKCFSLEKKGDQMGMYLDAFIAQNFNNIKEWTNFFSMDFVEEGYVRKLVDTFNTVAPFVAQDL